jgi:hypothetical protein
MISFFFGRFSPAARLRDGDATDVYTKTKIAGRIHQNAHCWAADMGSNRFGSYRVPVSLFPLDPGLQKSQEYFNHL